MGGWNLPDGCCDSDIPGCSPNDYEYEEWFNYMSGQLTLYCDFSGWVWDDTKRLLSWFENRYMDGDYRKIKERPDMDQIIEDFKRHRGEAESLAGG